MKKVCSVYEYRSGYAPVFIEGGLTVSQAEKAVNNGSGRFAIDMDTGEGVRPYRNDYSPSVRRK